MNTSTTLMLEPTATAQWHRLVMEAETECQCHLSESLQSYLVFMLMRFLQRPDLVNRVFALEFLQSLSSATHTTASRQYLKWRELGDQCLLFSGFFPGQADRRLVSARYFIDLGRTAYYQLAATRHEMAALYNELVAGFVVLRDLLQTIREMDGRVCLQPLAAIELWQQTRSQKAYQTMQQQIPQIPVILPQSFQH